MFALSFKHAIRTRAIQQPSVFIQTPSRFLSNARKYTLDHEWVQVNNNIATIGITDYAQKALGDVVYIDLPVKGNTQVRKDTIGAVESVKAASDIYAPISGTIVEVNKALESTPSLINTDPYDKGWIARIELSESGVKEAEGLMDESAYTKHISE